MYVALIAYSTEPLCASAPGGKKSATSGSASASIQVAPTRRGEGGRIGTDVRTSGGLRGVRRAGAFQSVLKFPICRYPQGICLPAASGGGNCPEERKFRARPTRAVACEVRPSFRRSRAQCPCPPPLRRAARQARSIRG